MRWIRVAAAAAFGAVCGYAIDDPLLFAIVILAGTVWRLTAEVRS